MKKTKDSEDRKGILLGMYKHTVLTSGFTYGIVVFPGDVVELLLLYNNHSRSKQVVEPVEPLVMHGVQEVKNFTRFISPQLKQLLSDRHAD